MLYVSWQYHGPFKKWKCSGRIQFGTAVADISLAPESAAAVIRPQVYPVNGQDVVTGDDRAVRRVHVSVVRKEPRFHEEAQEWWLPQVETELQAAISASVMAISVAEITVV